MFNIKWQNEITNCTGIVITCTHLLPSEREDNFRPVT